MATEEQPVISNPHRYVSETKMLRSAALHGWMTKERRAKVAEQMEADATGHPEARFRIAAAKVLAMGERNDIERRKLHMPPPPGAVVNVLVLPESIRGAVASTQGDLAEMTERLLGGAAPPEAPIPAPARAAENPLDAPPDPTVQ